MYCPRCNLHSEEYVDKCPLCAGPMEVEEVGSALMETPPILPEKEKSDDFLKEESPEIPDEDFGEETGLSGLEVEQEKIVSEAKTGSDEKKEGDEKGKIPPSHEAEYLFDKTARLYQQEIPGHAGGKKLSPIFIGIGILLILIFIGWGYFYFSQSGLKKLKVGFLNKKEEPSPKPLASSPVSIGEAKKKSSELLLAKPEEVAQPLPPEKTGSVQLGEKEENSSVTTQETKAETKKTETALPEVKKPEVVKSETIQPERKAPFTPLKPSEMLSEKQKAKENATLVPPSSVKPQEETLKAMAPKEISSKGMETFPPTPDPKGQYAILVGSFKVEGNALELKDALQKKGYSVRSYSVELPGKGSWYRVIVGNYANLQETKRVASKLKTEEKVTALIMKGDKYN